MVVVVVVVVGRGDFFFPTAYITVGGERTRGARPGQKKEKGKER